jgi:hypothetical protein
MVAVVVDGDRDGDGDNEINQTVETVETIREAVDNGNR